MVADASRGVGADRGARGRRTLDHARALVYMLLFSGARMMDSTTTPSRVPVQSIRELDTYQQTTKGG